ncbi:MAG TPA: hypothetical protein VH988_04960 [Thermoanaerobaculia bacterium]|jgi:hypothetical protein|nr:hypothetical protein [Thermoanaerobaculia bacterium]
MLETTLLAKLITFAGALLTCGFFGVVALKIVTGEMSLAHLLDAKDGTPNGSYSPARLQLLIFTVVVAANYLHGVITNPQQNSLPDLPMSVVAALGGSHAVYLGSKAFSTFVKPLLKKPE